MSKTHFNCDVFSIESFIQFQPEELDIPYIANLNNKGVITECFVIQKECTDLLNKILKIIKSRYE